VEDKEAKRKRMYLLLCVFCCCFVDFFSCSEANKKAQEQLTSFTLPIVGVVFAVLIVLIFVGSNLGSPGRLPSPPPKK